MKTNKGLREPARFDTDDLRRGTRLAPAKKSGKDRRRMFDDDEDDDPAPIARRESAFDYFDDGEEDDQ